MRVLKFDGTNNVHKLFGVIATNEDYLDTTGKLVPFAIPKILSVYDDTIPEDAATAKCRKLEAVWVAKINDCDLYEVADAGS